MKPRRPVFYGWFVVAASFAIAMCLGEVMWSFGVFFKALENDFGWSRGLTSSGYTLLFVGYGISAIASGRLADKYTARPVLLIASLLAGCAIALCSRVETLFQLQALLFVAGLGTGPVMPAPTSAVQRWFHDRARGGVALGVAMAGVGVGAVVFAPFINYLVLTFGWRHAFVIAGAVFSLVVGGSALVIKPSAPWRSDSSAKSANCAPQDPPLPTRRIIRTPQFAAVVVVMMTSTFAFQVLTVHLVPFATDAGISHTAAAAALGLAGGASVPGRMLSGLASEKLGWGRTLAIAQVGIGVSLLGLPLADRIWLLYGCVALYGFCQGSRAVSVFGVLGRVFGMRAIGELTGIVIAVSQIVGASTPYAAGYMFDRWGSYSLTFIPLGVLLVLSAYLAMRLDGDAGENPGQ